MKKVEEESHWGMKVLRYLIPVGFFLFCTKRGKNRY